MAYLTRVIPAKKRRLPQAAPSGKTPYGLQVIEGCLTCPLVKDHLFCDLPHSALSALDTISSSATYPKDAVLFVEGQEPRGVFVICNGRVKLSTNSSGGQSLIVRFAEPGEIVGLAGTLSGAPYELSAEAIEPLQASFIPRDAFLRFLRENGEAALRVGEMLAKIYHSTLMEVRYLGFSSSAAEKLARFLFDLPVVAQGEAGDIRKTLTLTHKEIGEMIGATRETVTRLFSHFKREGLVEIHGATLVIPDSDQLAKVFGG